MLDNLVGPDGIASKELVNHVRKLCELTREDLSSMANVFAELKESVLSEEGKFLQSVEKNVKAFQKDRNLLPHIPGVSTFIFKQWAQRNLTRKQILDDLAGIGISEQQKAKLELLLTAMEENIDAARRELLEYTAIRIGIPKIKNVLCSCDARAVFRDFKYQEEEGDEQPYFVLDHFIPVAILEIVSRLNEEEINHTFLLDEENLNDLCNILQRARKRLEQVKAALGKSSFLKG